MKYVKIHVKFLSSLLSKYTSNEVLAADKHVELFDQDIQKT